MSRVINQSWAKAMRMIDLMEGYLSKKDLLSEAKVSTSSLPVKKQKIVDWKVFDNPQRYGKKFKFDNHEKFLNFVVAVLQYEDRVKHNAKITIGYPEVIIEVWTHRLEEITDMDRDYCREIDYIYSELF